jgi:hypothetical protein
MAPLPSFDTSWVSPTDAVVTLRSLPRRFGEAFDRAARAAGAADDDDDVITRRPADGGLSPLAHAAWTASALEEIGSAFRRVQEASNPPITLPARDPPGPVDGPDDTMASVLARLGDRARSVADALAAVHGVDWLRTGQAATGPVSALDIARHGVRLGVEHLRAVEAATRPGGR